MKAGKDYIGVGVGGIIVGVDGRVLLAQRGAEARNQRGQWENPGGALEFGELFEDAIVREIREELAIEVVAEGILRIVNHIIPADHQHWVSPTLICRHVSGIPCIQEPEKCAAVQWFGLNELPEPLTSISRTDLAYFRQLVASGRPPLPLAWGWPDEAAGGTRSDVR